MKNLLLLPFLFALVLAGCKSKPNKEEQSKVQEPEKTVETAKYVLANATAQINFTAYKTTAKVGVKGTFTEVENTNASEGKTIKEALNGAEFKVPVSSIETNDAGRNAKIIGFFFKTMENTMNMTGKINIVDDANGDIDFTMNGMTEKLPFTYTIVDKSFTLKAKMNTDNWKAEEAIAKLNEVCKALHTGADGVSKTWSEVDIEVAVNF